MEGGWVRPLTISNFGEHDSEVDSWLPRSAQNIDDVLEQRIQGYVRSLQQ